MASGYFIIEINFELLASDSWRACETPGQSASNAGCPSDDFVRLGRKVMPRCGYRYFDTAGVTQVQLESNRCAKSILAK